MSATRRVQNHSADKFLPLSNANFHILLTLVDGERHGYAIMQEVREATEGSIRLGPGTLYRCIQALLQDSLIEESTHRLSEGDDQRRRYYRLTALGRRVLSAEARRLASVVAMAMAKKILKRLPA